MFQDVKEKVQLVKDLMAVQIRLKVSIPESVWDNARIGVVCTLLCDIVYELNSGAVSDLSVSNLQRFVHICTDVLELPYLNADQKYTLKVIKDMAVKEAIKR